MTMTQQRTTSEDRAGATRRILTRAASAQGGERRVLFDEAVHLNLPVARALASRYRNRGQASEDLEQAACLALTAAVHGFEPRAGKDFLSYAVPTIRGELKRYLRDAAWTVRPPRRVQEMQAATSAVRGSRRARPSAPRQPADQRSADLLAGVMAAATARQCRWCLDSSSKVRTLDTPQGI